MGELITGMVPGISDEATTGLVERAGGIPLLHLVHDQTEGIGVQTAASYNFV